MSRERCRSRSGGFTLVEMAVVLGVACVLMIIVGNILISSSTSTEHLIAESRMDFEVKRAMKALLGDLQASAPSVSTIDPSGTDYDSITYQVPGPFTGVRQWGAFDASHQWQPSWSVRFLVVQGNLVRRILDGSGQPRGSDEIYVRRIDNLRDGQKGFMVTRTGSLVTASIRILRTSREGHQSQKEYSSSTCMRNT